MSLTRIALLLLTLAFFAFDARESLSAQIDEIILASKQQVEIFNFRRGVDSVERDVFINEDGSKFYDALGSHSKVAVRKSKLFLVSQFPSKEPELVTVDRVSTSRERYKISGITSPIRAIEINDDLSRLAFQHRPDKLSVYAVDKKKVEVTLSLPRMKIDLQSFPIERDKLEFSFFAPRWIDDSTLLCVLSAKAKTPSPIKAGWYRLTERFYIGRIDIPTEEMTVMTTGCHPTHIVNNSGFYFVQSTDDFTENVLCWFDIHRSKSREICKLKSSGLLGGIAVTKDDQIVYYLSDYPETTLNSVELRTKTEKQLFSFSSLGETMLQVLLTHTRPRYGALSVYGW